MYTTSPVNSPQQSRSPLPSGPTSVRACQSCRTAKIRCSRELPSCQSCVVRGKGQLCFYRTSGYQSLVCEPCRNAKTRCSGELPSCKGCLGGRASKTCIYKTSRQGSQTPSPGLVSPNRKGQASASGPSDKLGSVDTQSPGETIPFTALNAKQYNDYDKDTQCNGSLPCPGPPATTAYSKMKPSVSWPYTHA